MTLNLNLFVMKKMIFPLAIGSLMLFGCNGKSGGADQSTPQGVAETIFASAKSGDFGKLKELCNAALEPDGDSKKICEVPDGDEKLKSSFKEYFSKGKVVGEPTIDGDKAAVKVLFGPDGTKEETCSGCLQFGCR